MTHNPYKKSSILLVRPYFVIVIVFSKKIDANGP